MESRESSHSPRQSFSDTGERRVNSRMSSERNLNDQTTENGTYNRDHYDRSPDVRRRSRSPQRARSRSPIHRSRSPTTRRRSPAHRDRKDFFSRTRRPVREKDCRVFISNLSFDTRWQNLKDTMKKIGPVEHVEIFTGSNGRSTGIGIVEFESADDASKAIRDMDGMELDGRKLKLREDQMSDDKYRDQLRSEKLKSNRSKVMPSDNKSSSIGVTGLFGLGSAVGGLGTTLIGLPTIQLQLYNLLYSKSDEPNSTVFVSNLDFDMDWRHLKDVFRRAGNCLRSDVSLDHERKSKGYGTVVYESPMEALIAIAIFDKMSVGKRKLAVRLDRMASLNQIMKQLGVDMESLNMRHVLQLHAMATLGAHSSSASLPGLGAGLSGGLTASTINNTADNLNSQQSQNVNTLGGLAGLRQMAGFFQGGSNSLMTQAFDVAGSTDVGRRAERRTDTAGRRHYLDSNHGTTSVGSRRESANECKVFVRNLPFSMKWQDLKDKFSNVGHVTSANVMMDERNRSKGYGTVLYETKNDAMKAIDTFNRSKIDGREIEVRLDWDRR